MRNTNIPIRTMMMGLLGVLSFGIIMTTPARAEDPYQSLTISPTDVHYDPVKPGEVVADSITVLNSGQTTIDFIVYASPYSVEDSTYEQDFSDTSKPRADAYKWVQFDKTKYQIGPRETIKVPYSLSIDKNASPGGHYGVIFVEGNVDRSNGGIARKKRLGTLVYVTVDGNVTRSGQVESISLSSFQTTPPLSVSTTVTNTGNTDFKTTATIEARDVFGSVLFKTKNERYVMPDTTRTMEIEWPNSPWIGMYNVKVVVDVLGRQTTKESMVLVLPRWILFIVGLLAVVGVAGAIRRQKKHQR